ncbi:hypothetical protein AN1V17_42960 [Vallitalea sediminicola]
MATRFKSYKEFLNAISRGADIEFKYKNKFYAVTITNVGIVASEQYNENSEKIYNDPIEVGNYWVYDDYLKNIILDVEILFRSL